MADEAMSQARLLAESQQWLLSAEQLRTLGASPSMVRTRLRRGEWRALLHGVYLVDADMYDEVAPSLLWRAALMRHGPTALLVGCTGARALGIQGLPPGDNAIEVALVGGPSRVTQPIEAPGGGGEAVVVVRQLAVRGDEVVIVDGLRVRRAIKTVIDAALQLDRVHALCALDSALNLKLLGRDELAAEVVGAARRRGARQLRAVAGLADERAESPLETRIRLACVDGDLAPDELQYEVQQEPGITVAIGDLAWLRRRRRPLLGECDGVGVHALPRPLFRDRRRGNVLTGLACDTVRFTWEDSLRPAYVQWVVRSAIAADGPIAS